MKLIDSIARDSKNVNMYVCYTIGLLLTLFSIFILYMLQPIDLEIYLKVNKFIEVVFLPVTTLVTLFIHECIHILLFIVFGKGHAKIKVRRDEELKAIIIHQINDKVYYRKFEIIIILLSPLVILSILLYILMQYINLTFLIGITLILNVLGSTIDFYLSLMLLFKYNNKIIINFSSNEIKMNIYSF